MRLALVLFRGELGGAEIVTAELARALRQSGVDATIVFALTSAPLDERLDRAGVPFRELGMPYHRDVLLHSRRLAQLVSEAGNGAILVDCGYLGLALRLGGYHGRIVGVEHGPLLELESLPWARRLFMRIARVANAYADDVDVAVSEHMLQRMRRAPRARRILCIHNGIDLTDPGPRDDQHDPRRRRSTHLGSNSAAVSQPVVVGAAGRFVRGKGFDDLLRAFDLIRSRMPEVELKVAGGGPEFDDLRRLAEVLGIHDSVQLLGPVSDTRGLWQSSDIAVVPSNGFPESFSMVTLEAMAAALPVVATRNGGIPELVVDGVTGTLVDRGDPRAIADAILAYARDPELRRAHGAAARQRCETHFDITEVARRYLELFDEPDSARVAAAPTRGPQLLRGRRRPRKQPVEPAPRPSVSD